MAKSESTISQKVLNVWAISLILWSFYRFTFTTSQPVWVDEFIAKPLLFLLPLFWYVTKSEKQPFLKGIGVEAKHIWTNIFMGVGVGGLFLLLAFLVRFLKGGTLPHLVLSTSSLVWVLAMVAAGTTEQVLSTGFVFKRLHEESKKIIQPVITSAFLFFFLHIPVLLGTAKIIPSVVIQTMALNIVLSVITSVLYLLRKSTIPAIVAHLLFFLSLPLLV